MNAADIGIARRITATDGGRQFAVGKYPLHRAAILASLQDLQEWLPGPVASRLTMVQVECAIARCLRSGQSDGAHGLVPFSTELSVNWVEGGINIRLGRMGASTDHLIPLADLPPASIEARTGELLSPVPFPAATPARRRRWVRKCSRPGHFRVGVTGKDGGKLDDFLERALKLLESRNLNGTGVLLPGGRRSADELELFVTAAAGRSRDVNEVDRRQVSAWLQQNGKTVRYRVGPLR